MSPEELALSKPLVDVQPVFNVMHIATSGEGGNYTPAMRAFVRDKLHESAAQMKETVKWIEERIGKAPK